MCYVVSVCIKEPKVVEIKLLELSTKALLLTRVQLLKRCVPYHGLGSTAGMFQVQIV